MCGLGINQICDYAVFDGANVPRYRFTYESKPDVLAKGLGSDSFTIYCEGIETAKERVRYPKLSVLLQSLIKPKILIQPK